MAYWSELNQTAAVGGCDSFRAANDIQLAEDAFDVSLYGAFADEKFGTDLFIALAGGDPLQNFDLSSAQCFAADAIGYVKAVCRFENGSWSARLERQQCHRHRDGMCGRRQRARSE